MKSAEDQPSIEGNQADDYICDFCVDSAHEALQLYVRNEKGVCPTCITYFLTVPLTCGKRLGVTTF
jgi:hypothetical protein